MKGTPMLIPDMIAKKGSSFSWEYGMGYILQRRSAWYEPRGEAMASPRGS